MTGMLLMLACIVTLQCITAKPISIVDSDQLTPYDADDIVSSDVIVKRSTKQVDPLLQKLHSRVQRSPSDDASRRHVNGHPLDLFSEEERDRLPDLLTDAILLQRLRNGELPRAEVWSSAGLTNDDRDWLQRQVEHLKLASERRSEKRSHRGQLRSPRELHPVYLGLGQNAASAALDTYASLLADEKRREEEQGSSNPVTFIGKR